MQITYGQIQPLRMLCLAPHPDDAEIGAGGTLIRSAEEGWPVGILELTRGEGGTLGTPEIREAECKAAAQLMGLTFRGQLGFPDGGITNIPETAGQLAQALRLLQPQILLVPHPKDRHPDHYAAYQLAKSAVHLAGLAKAKLTGEPHRPLRFLLYQGNAPISPTLLIDIEMVHARWQAAVLAHASQFTGQKISETVTPEIIERRSARQMYWGTFAGKRYCEAFESEIPLLLDLQAITF